MNKYVKLILNTKSRMTDQIYTYKIPEDMDLSIGQRVMVPFGRGNKKVLAIVVDFTGDIDKNINYKEIDREIESQPIINQELINIALFMSDKYLSDYSSSINTVLPAGDIVKIKELFKSEKIIDDFTEYIKKSKSYEEIKQAFPLISRKELKELVDKGYIKTKVALSRDASIKKQRYVQLVSNNRSKISNAAHKQIEIFNYLSDCMDNKALQKDLLMATNSSLSSVKSLEKKGIVEIYDEEIYRQVSPQVIEEYKKHQLNPDQSNVFEEISNSQSETFLLKGVTGSGKTEIYLHLVEQAIKKNKQAIVLVPEISLTPQTIERFSGRFGNRVAVMHSKLSVNERFDQWRMIKEGIFDIVVGTRSAIFAPLDNIGIIIIDEEHELSYINEKNPKYDAIDIASYRANYHNCNLVLGSATPRIESYFKADRGEYKLLELNTRVSDRSLPRVELVDMRLELKNGNFSMFSQGLKNSINEALDNNKQTILFLNKRGHTSYVFCRKCGYAQKCSACDSSMTYHKNKNLSICHLCGRTEKKPLICPECGSNAIKEFGAGTEKLEEATKEEFPHAIVARMDADTMSKKGSYKRIYDDMENKKIDILIGTQMVSKGFDFKDVDVVGIVAADISLNIPDFRANEKTFQLITQVAGRAGRGDNMGVVYIQSYELYNYAIRFSQNHDYESFYEEEIKNRKLYKYPPFYDLLLVRVIHGNRNMAFTRAMEIAKKIRKASSHLDIEIIGPNSAVIDRINNEYRFNLLLKTKNSIGEIKNIVDKTVLRNSDYSKNGFKYYVMINPNSL